MTYSTKKLTPAQAAMFGLMFDEKVGTERQTDGDESTRVITCFEVTPAEADKCRKIEKLIVADY